MTMTKMKKEPMTSTKPGMDLLRTALWGSCMFLLFGISAQAQVSTYTFAQSAGTYTNASGGTTLISGTFTDEVFTVALPAPFWFDGNYYTEVHISANGFLTFGSAPTDRNNTPISSVETYAGAVAPFGADMRNSKFGNPSLSYKHEGNEFIVQWRDVARQTLGLANERVSFQARLNLMTSQIRFRYTNVLSLHPYTSSQPQVGLRGPNANPGNYNNRFVGTGAEDWGTSLPGNLPTRRLRYTSSTPTKRPFDGLTYTWTPVCVPVAIQTPVLNADCAAGTYTVSVTVLSSGNAPHMDLVATPGGVLFDNVGPGTYVAGPYAITTPVQLRIVHNGSAACNGVIGTYDAISTCYNLISLTLNTDGNGAQTSWEILPALGGAPLYTGSGYGDNGTYTFSEWLPDGCYRLRFLDSFGDGMTTGGYVLRTGDGDRIIDNENDGDFGFVSEIAGGNGFCLPIGTDRIKASRCDLENLLPTEWIGAVENPAVSAQFAVGDQTDDGYQFWIFDPDGSYSRRILLTHASNNWIFPWGPARCSYLRLSNITSNPVPFDKLLNVRVRTMVNGVYSEFGPACRLKIDITAANCPVTQLLDDVSDAHHSCGLTNVMLDGSKTIYAQYVSNAVQYQFEFVDPFSGQTRMIASPGSHLLLDQWATNPLHYGTMYSVRVRVSYDNGATYCPWGPSCSITTAPPPPPGAPRSLDAEAGTFNMWPNPNNGDQLYLTLTDLEQSDMLVQVDLYDMYGKRVVARTINAQNHTLNTTISFDQDLATGIYLVNVTAGNRTLTERLFIQ